MQGSWHEATPESPNAKKRMEDALGCLGMPGDSVSAEVKHERGVKNHMVVWQILKDMQECLDVVIMIS